MTEVPEQLFAENLLCPFAEHLSIQPAFPWNSDRYPDAFAAGRHAVYSNLLDQSASPLLCRRGTDKCSDRINAFWVGTTPRVLTKESELQST